MSRHSVQGQTVISTPDKGWSWVVLMGSQIVMGLTLPFPSCMGIFFTELQKEFQTSNSETSWVPSIMLALLHAGGPLCSILVERYGCRITVMLGGLLSGIGMAASSFCQTIGQLYFTAGLITGLGFCFSFQSSVTVLGFYFVRRRALANALASTGTAIGMTLLPLLSQYLLVEMGWRGGFLIIGALFLNSCVCGALMRPVQSQHTSSSGKSTKDIEMENLESSNHQNIQNVLSDPKALSGTTQCNSDHDTQSKARRFVELLQQYMAFDLFCNNKRYQIYTIGVTWAFLGFMVPLVYLVPYATSIGMKENKAALLMAILGFINIFMRPLSGVISELRVFSGKTIYLFSIALVVNGLSNCICGAGVGLPSLVAYCVLYGISTSIIASLIFQVLMETVEMNRFSSALGLFTILESITMIIGPPLAGLLVDVTQKYSYVFFACSAVTASAGLFIGISFFILEKQDSKMRLMQTTHPSPQERKKDLDTINFSP
nr:PREDICTED: monocarboxylate transporter 6 isoform X2 [Latimeria chalumnae]|eukprot:XP_005998310.1 PREDICTED: monocarboxylate transporter 6 isoform X2 [Latimeria chalumnae]